MSLPENDFDTLRKLLACKRHEQPPPGYFNDFSDRVIARLNTEDLTEYSSWWQWLVAKFDAKPFLVCVYGLTVSSLLLAGFHLSEVFETEVARNPVTTLPWLATTPASALVGPSELTQNGAIFDSSAAPFNPALNPALLQSDPSHLLFNGRGLRAQPIGFPSSY
jgi:hypothetical protein